jgi:solute carrier family 1 (high affinity glutamate transporter) protein 1
VPAGRMGYSRFGCSALVDERVVRFVALLGSTLDMDGTRYYERARGYVHRPGLRARAGSGGVSDHFPDCYPRRCRGGAGIPEAGLVTRVIVLHSVDLPLDGVSLLLAVDWFLDRFRTTVNVWGEAFGAAVVERSCLTAPPDKPGPLPVVAACPSSG